MFPSAEMRSIFYESYLHVHSILERDPRDSFSREDLLGVVDEVADQFAVEGAGAVRAAHKTLELAQALARAALNTENLQNVPGVYFMYDDSGRVVYVGESERVLGRVGNGHKCARKFRYAKMLRTYGTRALRLCVENAYISLLQPPMNEGKLYSLEASGLSVKSFQAALTPKSANNMVQIGGAA